MARILALTSLLLVGTARADEGIAPETLDFVKHATVLVRVDAGGKVSSGTGFAVECNNGTVLIATNHHVARPAYKLRAAAPNAKITVTFDGGTATERSHSATVLADDLENDLALLLATGVKDVPKPVGFRDAPQLVETMPVYTFGFPFGDVLAIDKKSPAITVGKAGISSLRKGDDGELAVVQIDGNLNPGNSGGPVVDARGKLVGIAVATIRNGQGIGLAVPSRELVKMMDGRVGAVRVTPRSGAVRIEADLVDPFKNLRTITACCVTVSPKAKRFTGPDLEKAPGVKSVTLKVDQGVASADLTLPSADGEILVQVKATTDQPDRTSATKVYIFPLTAKPSIPAAPGSHPLRKNGPAPRTRSQGSSAAPSTRSSRTRAATAPCSPASSTASASSSTVT